MKENPITSGPANSVSTRTKIILNPYEQIADYKSGVYNFSFPTSLQWMEERGKILFGDHFKIDPSDQPLIYKLLVYAIGVHEISQLFFPAGNPIFGETNTRNHL